MNEEQVGAWLGRYVAAWKAYDRDLIGDLFSADVRYRYQPYDDALEGRAAVVDSWFEDRDEQGRYDGNYRPVAIDGQTVVATGTSTYYDANREVAELYHNIFLMRFDGDGRCEEFTEWWVKKPGA
ncbi:MAG: nuclear transport factor 2 family protein [Actinobacteria bacterium]|nr:nuclear transport factor 2 family protein [Actinomycetota bacterium]